MVKNSSSGGHKHVVGDISRKPGFWGFLEPLMGPWRALCLFWEDFLARLPAWLSPWVRDIVDVGVTVLVIIVVLKALFGADMLVPLVVVTSESMVHEPGDMSWSTWMTDRGFTPQTVASLPMQGGFNMGDMILVKDPKAGLGDVIIYERDLDHLTFTSRDPIIHRVVGVANVRDYSVVGVEGTIDCLDAQSILPYVKTIKDCQGKIGYCPYPRIPSGGDFKFFITKGDHNDGTDQCNNRMNIAYPVNDAQVTGRALLRLPYLGWPKLILSFIFRLVTFQV
jgi:signal peptidase I